MSKLGYTWYPKDWGNSESVFELTLSERGLYRELIDLAMLNNNDTDVKLDVWCRKFFIEKSDLLKILMKLVSLSLIEYTSEKIFIPSCESRLKLVRGGSKGGKKSKPTPKPTPKPFESLYENNEKPTPKQIEIETKIEIESKDKRNIKENNLIDIFFNDIVNSSALETICRDTNIPKDTIVKLLPKFRTTCDLEYKDFNAFATHLKRWVVKNQTNQPIVNIKPAKTLN